MNKILILTTGSKMDKAMAESALVLTKDLRAHIALLGTIEIDAIGVETYGNKDSDYFSILKSRLQQEATRLESIIKANFSDDFFPSIEVIVRQGELADAVLTLTQEKDYLMVVMGGKKTESNDSYLCTELLSVTARSKSPVLVIGKDQLLSF